ncbi:MAG: acyl-CoA dehydrogenase [Acidimicrobiia bacterium]|nr:acyl-CoA dehydrogenase [Acidimicrobiia bacterium]
MNLEFTDEQRLLAETARAFVDRQRDGDDPWPAIAQAGWAAPLVPEGESAADAGIVELALVCEALGRGPVPSPLIATRVLASLPIYLDGTSEQQDRWLPAFADGSAIGTMALLESVSRDEWDTPGMSGVGRLSGTKIVVPWASRADVIVVATADGLRLVETASANVQIDGHDGLDGEPLAAVTFDSTDAEPLGTGDGGVTIAVVLDHAAVARLAYAVGAAERALELTVQHATDRHQFGRPIGSFQAVAHRCAEMRAEIDACRYLTYRAAWSLEHTTARSEAVTTAKSYANEALRRVFMHAHQVHGAMGFTTEHPLHRFTRVAKAFELSYGSTTRHRDRLATAMGLGPNV